MKALRTVVALLVGCEAAGIFGALVAVPVAAALQVLVQNLYVAIQEELHRPEERDDLRFEHAPLPRLANVDKLAFDASRPPAPGARLGKDAEGKPAWFVSNPDAPGKYMKVEA